MSSPAFLQGFLSNDRGIFGKVLGAVPESELDYRPDPISRSARDLIGHLLGHNLDLIELIDEGTIHHRNQVSFESVSAGTCGVVAICWGCGQLERRFRAWEPYVTRICGLYGHRNSWFWFRV